MTTQFLAALPHKCPRLRELHLHECDLKHLSLADFPPVLRYLSLANSQISFDFFTAAATRADKHKQQQQQLDVVAKQAAWFSKETQQQQQLVGSMPSDTDGAGDAATGYYSIFIHYFILLVLSIIYLFVMMISV